MGILLSTLVVNPMKQLLHRSLASIKGGKNYENLQQHSIAKRKKRKKKRKQHNITTTVYKYPTMTKTVGDFKLHVIGGEFTQSQIIVIQGMRGTGRTTLIRMLAGLLEPDSVDGKMPQFNVSYKPQEINPMPIPEDGSSTIVRDLFHDADIDPHFESHVMQPLLIEHLMDQQVVNLSLGELQRLELCLCLLKPADIYLIDEPSAYLTVKERMVASDVIKSFILHSKKTAFVVEPYASLAYHLHDRVILCKEGKSSTHCTAYKPQACLFNLHVIPNIEEIKTDSSKHSEQKGLLG